MKSENCENLDSAHSVTKQNHWHQDEIARHQHQKHSANSNHRIKSENQTPPPIVTQVLPTHHMMCPPGLEYLTTIDQLLVQQKVELVEVITGFETNNKFNVKNTLGQKVYWAAEVNDCCTRNCCGPLRRFDMKVYDIYQNEVIHIRRPAACSSCFFPCCLQSIEVFAPPGNVIGSVEQTWSVLYPQFAIKNANGDTILLMKGSFCTHSICGDVEFQILTLNGDEVGRISKQWSGLARELFTDADFFGISFPMDLDVHVKAIMLSACFLIDAMFFKKAGNREEDRAGMI